MDHWHACKICSCRWECINPKCDAPHHTICPWDEAHKNGVNNLPNVSHVHAGNPCDVCEAYKKGKAVRALRIAARKNGRGGLPNVQHAHANKFCGICDAYREGQASV